MIRKLLAISMLLGTSVFFLPSNIFASEILGIPIEMVDIPCANYEAAKDKCAINAPPALKKWKFRKVYTFWKKNNGKYRLYRIYSESSAFMKASRTNGIIETVEEAIGSKLQCKTDKISGVPGASMTFCEIRKSTFKADVFAAGGGGGASRYSVSINIDDGFTNTINEVETNQKPTQNTEVIESLSSTGNNIQQKSTKLDIAKKECEEIGYKPKTEKFADCVMKLIE